MSLAQLLEKAVEKTKFRTEDGTLLTPIQLRHKICKSYWGSPNLEQVRYARLEVPDNITKCLSDELSRLLDIQGEFPTGHIGHSFHISGSHNSRVTATQNWAIEIQQTSDHPTLAHSLVKAASITEPDATAQLLNGWAHGEPLRFTICSVLNDVYVDDRLDLGTGVRVYPLPASSQGLPQSLPAMDVSKVSTILGRAVLEIDAYTLPVFFPPQISSSPNQQTRTELGDVTVDTFLDALSLVCGFRVNMAYSWNHYFESDAFAITKSTSYLSSDDRLQKLGSALRHSSSDNIIELLDFEPPTSNLSIDQLRKACELSGKLQQRVKSSSRFRIAVARWNRSVSSSSPLEDRIIDLRIALESLYLDSEHGELGFRLSITGAKHLGTSLQDRKKIRKIFYDFYSLASRVIHGTTSKKVKSKQADSLNQASQLCRDGIAQILEQKYQPNWLDLLLQ